MAAIAAVDTALWDIKAKSLNMPLYQLLGGASRESVLVYGHASGGDIEETVQAVAKYKTPATRPFARSREFPGYASTYGVGRGIFYYEPAEKNAPPESRWSSEQYLNFVPQLFSRLRQGVWAGGTSAARRASPPDADRSGSTRQGTRAVSICFGWKIRRPRNCRKVSA